MAQLKTPLAIGPPTSVGVARAFRDSSLSPWGRGRGRRCGWGLDAGTAVGHCPWSLPLNQSPFPPAGGHFLQDPRTVRAGLARARRRRLAYPRPDRPRPGVPPLDSADLRAHRRTYPHVPKALRLHCDDCLCGQVLMVDGKPWQGSLGATLGGEQVAGAGVGMGGGNSMRCQSGNPELPITALQNLFQNSVEVILGYSWKRKPPQRCVDAPIC